MAISIIPGSLAILLSESEIASRSINPEKPLTADSPVSPNRSLATLTK